MKLITVADFHTVQITDGIFQFCGNVHICQSVGRDVTQIAAQIAAKCNDLRRHIVFRHNADISEIIIKKMRFKHGLSSKQFGSGFFCFCIDDGL